MQGLKYNFYVDFDINDKAFSISLEMYLDMPPAWYIFVSNVNVIIANSLC